jgi:hypothetical protein
MFIFAVEGAEDNIKSDTMPSFVSLSLSLFFGTSQKAS